MENSFQKNRGVNTREKCTLLDHTSCFTKPCPFQRSASPGWLPLCVNMKTGQRGGGWGERINDEDRAASFVEVLD
jgi:hypothetical protein